MFPAPFPVLLDANVLIPLTLRDTLLRAADEGLIQIYWSEQILDEVRRNLVRGIGLTEEKAAVVFPGPEAAQAPRVAASTRST